MLKNRAPEAIREICAKRGLNPDDDIIISGLTYAPGRLSPEAPKCGKIFNFSF